MLINQRHSSGGLTNVQQTPAVHRSVGAGQELQQLLEVDYTANVQTNQGTDQIYGGWVTLYNTANRRVGPLQSLRRESGTFKAALPDAAQMMLSMQ